MWNLVSIYKRISRDPFRVSIFAAAGVDEIFTTVVNVNVPPFVSAHSIPDPCDIGVTWCRHHMETLSALLAICTGNSPVDGEFPAQRPVTRNVDVFFDLHLNKRLSKQWWGWWFETPSRPLCRHCNVPSISFPYLTLQYTDVVYTLLAPCCDLLWFGTSWFYPLKLSTVEVRKRCCLLALTLLQP